MPIREAASLLESHSLVTEFTRHPNLIATFREGQVSRTLPSCRRDRNQVRVDAVLFRNPLTIFLFSEIIGTKEGALGHFYFYLGVGVQEVVLL